VTSATECDVFGATTRSSRPDPSGLAFTFMGTVTDPHGNPWRVSRLWRPWSLRAWRALEMPMSQQDQDATQRTGGWVGGAAGVANYSRVGWSTLELVVMTLLLPVTTVLRLVGVLPWTVRAAAWDGRAWRVEAVESARGWSSSGALVSRWREQVVGGQPLGS